jgi:hypothetical protein
MYESFVLGSHDVSHRSRAHGDLPFVRTGMRENMKHERSMNHDLSDVCGGGFSFHLPGCRADQARAVLSQKRQSIPIN